MIPFGVDEHGFIITEASIDKLTPQFKPIVENVLAAIIREIGSDIDSVYLYGSLATGKAVKGKSDLDMILVFKDKPDNQALEKVSILEKKLSEEYKQTFRDVGIGPTHSGDVQSEKERYGGLCFIKHLSVCLYGRDLAKSAPEFKPSKEVAKGLNGDIKQSLYSARLKIAKATSALELAKLSQSVAKKIIRTGFSLVMPRARSWTTDLQTACNTFAEYYPEKAKEMRTILVWSKEGTSDKQILIDLLDKFGHWLIAEFEKEIIENSGPTKGPLTPDPF